MAPVGAALYFLNLARWIFITSKIGFCLKNLLAASQYETTNIETTKEDPKMSLILFYNNAVSWRKVKTRMKIMFEVTKPAAGSINI